MKGIRVVTQAAQRCQSTLSRSQQVAVAVASRPERLTVKRSASKVSDVWVDAANNLTWSTPWHRSADMSNTQFPKWYTGGRMNACYDCVDRHVDDGRGDQVAIEYESSIGGADQRIVFSELHDMVSRLAGAFIDSGVRTGDRVLIFMPAIPQAIFAMLACARVGAIYVPVSGYLSAKELAMRMDHAKPRMIITTNGGVEDFRLTDYKSIADDAIALAEHKPTRHFVYQRSGFPKPTLKRSLDVDFDSAIRATRRRHQPVNVEANHPLYLEYSTDKAGNLNAVVRPTGGHAAAVSWTIENTFGVRSRANEKWLVANDATWAANHPYVVFAPLLNAVTTVQFEGTVDATNCFDVIDKYGCNVVLSTHSTIRAMYAQDPDSKHANHFDMQKLRHVMLTGETAYYGQWCKHAEIMFRKPVYETVWRLDAQRPVNEGLLDAAAASGDAKLLSGSKMLSVVSSNAERRSGVHVGN